jgi:nitrate/TMAO reductase-like tetraheme cytochrome c subunit
MYVAVGDHRPRTNSARGCLHMSDSVYELLQDYVHNLNTKGVGFDYLSDTNNNCLSTHIRKKS